MGSNPEIPPADIEGIMRWVYEIDGMADGLVVVDEPDLDGFPGQAPEMVVLIDKEKSKLTAYWHMEDGAFLREAFVGSA